MPYATNYSIVFLNAKGVTYQILIEDTDSGVVGSGSEVYNDIVGKGLVISSIDNNEDKFTPIRAKQATIECYSSSTIGLNTFTEGDDQRFLVSISPEGGSAIFKGYLVMDANSIPFMPNPSVIKLVATDQLAVLRGQELKTPAGAKLNGYYKIITLISYCLQKTGLQLNINVISNLFEETHSNRSTGSSNCAFNQTYLDDRTFEKDVISHEDCYTVLEKICHSFGCELYQYNNEWWVVRIGEYLNPSFNYTKYDYQGAIVSGHSAATFTQTIGVTEKFVYENAIVSAVRPVKSQSHTFRLDLPAEIVRNIDFERGTVYSTTATETRSTIDDWTHSKGPFNAPGTVDNAGYIKRVIEDGYEKERYIVFTAGTTSAAALGHAFSNYLKSQPIPIGAGDRFTYSVDWRANVNWPDSHVQMIANAFLVADDGTYYWLGRWNGETDWFQSGVSGNSNIAKARDYVEDCDGVDWKTVAWAAPPCPKSGNLYLYLWDANQRTDTFDTVTMEFQNLIFDYEPKINGSYKKYRSYEHKITQTGDYNSKRESDFAISESPRKLFKGGLHVLSGAAYVLAGDWYDYNSGTTPVKPFRYWLAYSEFLQYKFRTYVIQATVQGSTTFPDLIHKITLSYTTGYTTDKLFKFLHYEMDYYTCEWSCTMAEIYDSNNSYGIGDTYDFKWLT